MGRKRNEFEDSLRRNNYTFRQYVDRLTSLGVSMFKWINLPPEIDARYLERTLFWNGNAVFFMDDDLDQYLALSCTTSGDFDVYGNPKRRRAYSKYNNYQRELNADNSVIIWNNYLRTNSLLDVEMYAKRLYELDRIIDVNARAQKTPVLVQCSEDQRLTMLNIYKEFDGNAPVIFGGKNLDVSGLKVLQTGAPYVCDKLYTLKTQLWNEALTYLGISNVNIQKKERLISDEVTRNEGGVIANRYSRLEARKQACDQINAMFGTDIQCEFREDFRVSDGNSIDSGETGDGETKEIVEEGE